MITTLRAAIVFSASKGAKNQKHRDFVYFSGDKLEVFLLDVFTATIALRPVIWSKDIPLYLIKQPLLKTKNMNFLIPWRGPVSHSIGIKIIGTIFHDS